MHAYSCLQNYRNCGGNYPYYWLVRFKNNLKEQIILCRAKLFTPNQTNLPVYYYIL